MTQPGPQQLRSRNVRPLLVPAVAAPFLLAGCGEEEVAYCTVEDQNGETVVVENHYCEDNDDGAYFWYFGAPGTAYHSGSRIPAKALRDGSKIHVSNTKALSSHPGYNARTGGFGGSARAVGSPARSTGGFGGFGG